MNDDFKIELFVFPDGTEIEMIVFEQARPRPRSLSSASGSDAVTQPMRGGAPGNAAHAPAVAPKPPTTSAPVSTSSPDATIDPAVVRPEDASEARVCPHCGSDLVYPVDWQRCGDAVWDLELRCPDCETRRHTLVGRSAVEAFNRDLYLGAQALAHDAESLDRHAFEHDVERLVEALDEGLIQPMDF